MKKSVLLSVFILVFGTKAMSQRVLKIRPAKPKVVLVKPHSSNANHIWIEGHWKWSIKQNRYVWRKGHWVRKRRGYVYMGGRWKATPNGYI